MIGTTNSNAFYLQWKKKFFRKFLHCISNQIDDFYGLVDCRFWILVTTDLVIEF